jgi:hypothetical protein
MRLQATLKHKPNELSGAALAASRQVWLAGLGAAVVSRDWIQAEAGNTFRTLVKEGTVVESRAIRYVGDQVEASMTRANELWKQTRATVQGTVRQAADSAVLFVKETLPRSLPKLELPTTAAAAKRRKAVAKRAAKAPAKRAATKTRAKKRTAARA